MQIILDAYRNGKTPTWSIIEIQGELQNNKAASSFHGKVIGDLHYNLELVCEGNFRKQPERITHGEPLLVIGHHVLTGRVAKLEKPLAILKRKPKSDEYEVTEYEVQGVVVQKLLFSERPRPIVANADAIIVK